jgi:dGTPase
VMVNDVIETTRANIASERVETADDIRSAGKALGGFSSELAERERQLKTFMYANLYHHPTQVAAADEAKQVVAQLFAAYSNDPGLMPEEWRSSMPGEEPQRSRHISDFLAGMTDRYALNCHRAIYGEQR